jgi:hypothetical protein
MQIIAQTGFWPLYGQIRRIYQRLLPGTYPSRVPSG